ncbi:hypothetical protein PPACK8108_LOCUS22870, partial [Phakopsora pachyrhizi]
TSYMFQTGSINHSLISLLNSRQLSIDRPFRAKVQLELQRLSQCVVAESEKRSKSEASLSSINKELDDLSVSLFSEANRLAERKVEEVEEAMQRVEEMIDARRDQLNLLRVSLEQAERDRDHYKLQFETLGTRLSPFHPHQQLIISAQDSNLPVSAPASITLTASHLLHSVPSDVLLISSNPTFPLTPRPQSGDSDLFFSSHFRLARDITPFLEFNQFISYLRRTRLDTLARSSHTPSLSDPHYSASLSKSNTTSLTSSTHRSSLPSSGLSSKDLNSPRQKDLMPFLKRCIDEDSDPTLRLDLAPALNFISRRAIAAAILEGHLVIEPIWNGHESEYEKCSMCGCCLEKWIPPRLNPLASTERMPDTSGASPPEANQSTVRKILRGGGWSFGTLNRTKSNSTVTRAANPIKSVANSSGRTTPSQDEPTTSPIHTFRAGETAATRYPICPTYCLNRLRSVCSFWTFVRSLQSGILLDESSRFMHSIAPHSASSRSIESVSSPCPPGETGLNTLRQKGGSLESVIDSPILTHSTSSFPSSPTNASRTGSKPDLAAAFSADSLTVPLEETTEELSHQAAGAIDSSDHAPKYEVDDQKTRSRPKSSSEDPTTGTDIHLATSGSQPLPGGSQNIEVENAIQEDKAKHRSVDLATADSSPSRPPVPQRSAARNSHPRPEALMPLSIPAQGQLSVKAIGGSFSEISKSASGKRSRPLIPSFEPPTEQNPQNGAVEEKGHNQSSTKPTSPIEEKSLMTPISSHRRGSGQARVLSGTQQIGVEDLPAGWEERCWNQVIKLKEDMFCKRVGLEILIGNE